MVPQDLMKFEMTDSTGEKVTINTRDYYNKVFLKSAKKFIVKETSELEPPLDEPVSAHSAQETCTDKLLKTMQLNSPLKDTVPTFAPEKSRSQMLRNFAYGQFSPRNRDYLISNSPDPRANRYLLMNSQ